MGKYNIVLIGQTGVGKSTFINAFANYITYPSFIDAANNEIINLIPTSFSISNETYEPVKISCGKDDNELTVVGQSSTQRCKAYLFPYGDNEINIIDTPGVGDVRGVKQDMENCEEIIAFIRNFENLHGICILLKPNESKLSGMFEYCIKQLLCHLPKSAADNIIFVFTNARSTFFKPGQTRTVLKMLLDNIKEKTGCLIPLNKETIYCVDNEAFRFLIASIKGIKFDQNQKRENIESWKKSYNECKRLLSHIIGTNNKPGLKPNKTQDIVSLNEARKVITILSPLLSELTKNIQENDQQICIHKEEFAEFERTIENNIARLRRKLVPIICDNNLLHSL